jgi:hypothetical protein
MEQVHDVPLQEEKKKEKIKRITMRRSARS